MTNLFDSIAVLYGSQTGNSEWIAKHIHTRLTSLGHSSTCLPLNSYSQALTTPLWIIITSSTGDGDPPDNALQFWKYIRKELTKESMVDKHYTLLGLGDTNYDQFCNVAKRIDKKLSGSGGRMFYGKAFADEAVGLESVVDPWIAGLWEAVGRVCVRDKSKVDVGVEELVMELNLASLKDKDKVGTLDGLSKEKATDLNETNVPIMSIKLDYKELESIETLKGVAKPLTETITKLVEALPTDAISNLKTSQSNIYKSRATHIQCLTGSQSAKKTLELTLDINRMDWKYLPGDAVGILPQNQSSVVDAILMRLGLDPNKRIKLIAEDTLCHYPVNVTTTYRTLLTHYFDIYATPKKSLLRLLGDYATDVNQKRMLYYLSSTTGIKSFKLLREQNPSLLDILHTFSSSTPPFIRIVENLIQLTPRFYSITTSPLSNFNTIQIVFNVVQYKQNEINRRGLFTGWIDDVTGRITKRNQRIALDNTISLTIFPKPPSAFRLPDDLSKPLILIGPGTGVSPFLGFLQHRRQQFKLNSSVRGDILLFYGCRLKTQDFLYENELKEFESDGTLTRLFVAFSREANSGEENSEKYVQHKMLNEWELLIELIEKREASVFVCGDALQMAKDVNSALLSILVKGGYTQIEAAEKLQKLVKENRYIKDIWS